ncbi:MAG TPA: hypothetical protein VIF09_28890 [Polyangiaceae bacterium]|jgi:hypothetical protein
MRLHTSVLLFASVAALASRSRAAAADDAVVIKVPELPVARSETPASTPVVAAREPECRKGWDIQQGFGVLFDGAKGPPSYGVRWLEDHRERRRCGDMSSLGSVGFALDVRGEGTSAMQGEGVIRIHGGDDKPWAGGFSLELAAGGATDGQRAIATGSVALLLDFGPAGIGASYQLPIGADRPAWMGSLGLALRVQIPLWVSESHEEAYAAGEHR